MLKPKSEIEVVYDAYISTKGRAGLKRKHPSFEEFQDILDFTVKFRQALYMLTELKQGEVKKD